MKCVFCERIYRAWKNGVGIGGICPRCWAKLYRAQIKERGGARELSEVCKAPTGARNPKRLVANDEALRRRIYKPLAEMSVTFWERGGATKRAEVRSGVTERSLAKFAPTTRNRTIS